jgi:hypothetical protein
MPTMGYESTISVFELAKTVRPLDRTAAVIGYFQTQIKIIPKLTASRNQQLENQNNFISLQITERNQVQHSDKWRTLAAVTRISPADRSDCISVI